MRHWDTYEPLSDPLGGFGVGTRGIIFNEKDPSINHTMNDKLDVYFIPLKIFIRPRRRSPGPSRQERMKERLPACAFRQMVNKATS